MKTRLFVIPYFAGDADGKELTWCIAGIRRHFVEPYLIALVGDYHPIATSGPDIIHVDCPRVGPPENPDLYQPHIDMANKFRIAARVFGNTFDEFIWYTDDYYAVNDFGLGEVAMPKILAWEIIGDATHPNGFKRDKARTKAMLQAGGYPTWNWTTHTPQFVEFEKMMKLFDRYDIERASYVIEDMYFNIYQGTRKPILLDILADTFKFGIYAPHPDPAMIERAFREKVWITNSPTGYVPELIAAMDAYYFGKNE